MKSRVMRALSEIRDQLLLAMTALERDDYDGVENHLGQAAEVLHTTITELRA